MTSRARSSSRVQLVEQNPGFALRHFERGQEQALEVMLDLPRLAGARARKGGRIENDRVKALAFSGQAREDSEDVVGEEAMAIGSEAVEGEIFLAAIERFARKID